MCVSYRESVHHRSIESIQDTNHPSIGGYENLFPIVTELKSSPVTDTTEPCLKGGKGTLFSVTEKTEKTIAQVYEG